MDCNSVVSVSYLVLDESPVQVAPFVPLVAGMENGKPYYTWTDATTGYSIKMYWSAINLRWEIAYSPFGVAQTLAFLNLPETDCPGIIGSNGWTYIDGKIINILTILAAPLIPVDDDTSCCINIQFTTREGDTINLACTKVFPLTFPASYAIDFDSIDPGVTLLLSIVDGVWQMADMSNPSIVYFVSNISFDCPESIYSESWVNVSRLIADFIIYRIECDINNNDIPADVEPINCDIPCTNGNLLKKQKASLANDIADISKREVFGLKCNDNWENIFMRSLIIDALSCLPYGIYSKDEEQCLIGNLTDNCNC